MMDDVGLCITQAWVSEHTPLRFLYGNKTFCDNFKIKEMNLPGESLNNILPVTI